MSEIPHHAGAQSPATFLSKWSLPNIVMPLQTLWKLPGQLVVIEEQVLQAGLVPELRRYLTTLLVWQRGSTFPGWTGSPTQLVISALNWFDWRS